MNRKFVTLGVLSVISLLLENMIDKGVEQSQTLSWSLALGRDRVWSSVLARVIERELGFGQDCRI